MGPNQSDWDRVLHERLVAGDGDALAEVYDAHAPVVYGLAIRVTGDHTAAEDITQDVFVRLWERPEDFDPCCGRLRTWLCTVARRRAIDWIRRARTRDRSAVAFGRERAITVSDIADTAIQESVAQSVRAAVQELPEPQRKAVVLAYYQGLTYRRVAEALGIPEGTAKSRVRFGLRGIADRLAAEGLLGE